MKKKNVENKKDETKEKEGKKEFKREYFDLDKVLKKAPDCQYYIITSMRSNGKTYQCLKRALQRYYDYGEKTAYVRRLEDNFSGVEVKTLFNSLEHNEKGENIVSQITHGEFDRIYYYSRTWYLAKLDDKGNIIHEPEPFVYGYSINREEKSKGSTIPSITTIIFDEYMSRDGYLQDEFIKFMNLVSTIKRNRRNMTIFMLGNTITYNPYWAEMGLKHVEKMKPGELQVYKFGENGSLKVCVHSAEAKINDKKDPDPFFCFDNPKLKMITEGAYEISIYPHCPVKYILKDVIYTYFIEFNDEILQCEIVSKNDEAFTFIHRKTTLYQERENDIIFCPKYDYRNLRRRNIKKPIDGIGEKILYFYNADKVFYQDNEVGELVNHYLEWCDLN